MSPEIDFIYSEEDIIPYFYGWAAAERWNPGTEGRKVVEVFYKSFPKSFYLAVVPDKNDSEKQNVVACNTVVKAMVWPFNHALKIIGERATVGLDGVLAQVKNYQRSGFTNSAWESQRTAADIDHFMSRLSSYETFGELNIMEISDIPFAELDALDARYSGFRRSAFLRNWIDYHTNKEEYGRLSCGVTENESPKVAKTILYHLAKSVGKVLSTLNKIPSSTSPVLDLDICAGNANAVSLFDELEISMSEVTTIRMYKGKQPNAELMAYMLPLL